MVKANIEQQAKLIIECYKDLNITMDDAIKLAKIKNDDYQSEILQVMQEYNFDFKRSKKFLG
jgi:hypothetical protein